MKTRLALGLSAAPLLLLGFFASPPPAWPASARALGLEEMADVADDIVLGRVVNSRPRWEGKLIVTQSVVRVEEWLKGRRGRKIKVRQLGGTAVHPVLGAAVSMTASSSVVLRPGEEVLLFVETRRRGVRGLVGGPQGKFLVREDPGTRERRIPVGPKRLMVIREGEREMLASEAIPLDALKARIRARLEGRTR